MPGKRDPCVRLQGKATRLPPIRWRRSQNVEQSHRSLPDSCCEGSSQAFDFSNIGFDIESETYSDLNGVQYALATLSSQSEFRMVTSCNAPPKGPD
jgi:hypothetical protein